MDIDLDVGISLGLGLRWPGRGIGEIDEAFGSWRKISAIVCVVYVIFHGQVARKLGPGKAGVMRFGNLGILVSIYEELVGRLVFEYIGLLAMDTCVSYLYRCDFCRYFGTLRVTYLRNICGV